MKSNEFEIKNNIRVSYGRRNHKVYKGNRPVLCRQCVEKHGYPVRTKQEQYETAEKGVQYMYDGERLTCPSCGNELEIIKTYDDWRREKEQELERARENVHLIFYDKSWSSGLEYYRLSTKLEPERWDKVKEYFMYVDYDYGDDEQDTMYGNHLKGWLTVAPKKVEEALDIRKELTLEYRNNVRKELRRKRNEETDRRNHLRRLIDSTFKERGVKPDGIVALKDIQGDCLEPLRFRWNIYGGGQRFIINDEECWFIRNNGRDGDDWSRNNIQTGGAGAIGVKIPYDEELDSWIREYCSIP